VESDIVEPSEFAEDVFHYSCITPSTGPTVRNQRLAAALETAV
jgi:hypothetical protein